MASSRVYLLFAALSILCVGSSKIGDDFDAFLNMLGLDKDLDQESDTRSNWKEDDVCDAGDKCVPYYLCKEDGNIKTDGKFLLNPRNEGISTPIPGCTALSMCCTQSDFVNKTNVEICESFVKAKKCGFRNPKGLGGTTGTMKDESSPLENDVIYSNYAEFPWMMAIIKKDGNVVMGGGSLIHPKVVLTSAHNTVNSSADSLIVRGGEWNAAVNSEICAHVDKSVDDIIRHENFNGSHGNYHNDIALVFLKSEFVLSPVINTICLPPQNHNFEGQTCYSSGWGKALFSIDAQIQLVLKRVELPILPHGDCQLKLRRTILGVDFRLHENFLCAGGEEGIDTCTGDGGGPLMCQIPGSGSYYQAGIVAAGIQCAKKDIPGLYTDVAKYRKWIDDKVFEGGIDDNSQYYAY